MEDNRKLYLELLKNTLIDLHRSNLTEYRPVKGKKINNFFNISFKIAKLFRKDQLTVCEKVNFNSEDRINGNDWPLYADSMIGYKRLSNIQDCLEQVIANKIDGDLIETGVWRGGAVIFMKAILKSYDVNDKIVWCADSFEGLPKPNAEKYKADENDKFYSFEELSVSENIVKQNFIKYNLLDDKVKFLKGWFKDTLPNAPFEKLCLLRLDGDMYESTMDGLKYLYPKLSIGGFVIVDDWGSVPSCQLAVNDYRKKHNITEEIIKIDNDGVYWKKTK
ncbi:MAG: class I SAM-dependent methyltransferase [Sphingobacteriaceae bacterium]|nr:class I SAM-dependent methyltransferase [Sphingobacteriaceae bacterium]